MVSITITKILLLFTESLLYARHWAKHFIHIYITISVNFQLSCDASTHYSHFIDEEHIQRD